MIVGAEEMVFKYRPQKPLLMEASSCSVKVVTPDTDVSAVVGVARNRILENVLI